MTLEDLKRISVFQTRTIAEVCKRSPETHAYIVECLQRFYKGDYGEIGQEDTAANNSDLLEGCGHVLARYKAKHALESDIYIESHFDAEVDNTEIDYNNTMICYVNER